MNLKNKKGQAAMEYLMTYGWALLVIVIVLALLLVIIGMYLRGTPQCSFQEAGFVCGEPAIPVISQHGHVYGAFQHGHDEPIIIHKFLVIDGQSDKNSIHTNCWRNIGFVNGRPPPLVGNITIAPNERLSFTQIKFGKETTSTVSTSLCDPTTGTFVSGLTPGTQVRGQLWIQYNYRSDSMIGFTGTRTAVATLVANVE